MLTCSWATGDVGDGCSCDVYHFAFVIDVMIMMSCGTCTFTCGMTLQELVSFSRAIARRDAMRIEREMKREGVWNDGKPSTVAGGYGIERCDVSSKHVCVLSCIC